MTTDQALADLTVRLEAIEAKLAAPPPALPSRRQRKPPAATGYEVRTNAQHGSREVYFDGKPSAAVRGALKSLGFRWYPAGGYWWGYAPENDLAAAIDRATT